MGADDVSMLVGPAIERSWLLGAPEFAPLAPLVATLLRGHMLQAFVPAYSDYTLAEDRRPPPTGRLPTPPQQPLMRREATTSTQPEDDEEEDEVEYTVAESSTVT